MTKIKEAERQTMIDLHAQGLGWTAIARQLNVSTTVIFYRAQKLGLKAPRSYRFINIEPGTTFEGSQWEVLKLSDHVGVRGEIHWDCRCLGCGTTQAVYSRYLRSGQSTKCHKCAANQWYQRTGKIKRARPVVNLVTKAEYPTVKAAAEAIGVTSTSIVIAIKNQGRCKGDRWAYADERQEVKS